MSVVKQILIPVSDIEQALDFYIGVMGFELKFRDGSRYAALDGGGTTIALLGPEEQVAGQSISFSVHVDDIAGTIETAQGKGAKLDRAAEQGPHEIRAVLTDTDGNSVVIYKKTA